MKRFLLKLCLLAALCTGILLVGSRAYLICLNTGYVRYRNETLKFDSVPEGIEHAAFGSSHSGASFLTERFPEGTAFNFFTSSQSAVMTAAYYDLYRDRLAENAYVWIAVSPSTLYYDDTADMTSVKRYCDSMPVSALPTLRMKLYRLFRLYDFQMSDVIEYFRTRNVTDFTGMETNDILASRITDIDTASRDWNAWGRELAGINLRLIGSDSPDGLDPAVRRSLEHMLSDCAARGLRVVLYTPPFTEEYRAGYPEGFFETVRRDAAALAEMYGAVYFGYADDARIAADHANFLDVDHLSVLGAERFMPLLLADAAAFFGN